MTDDPHTAAVRLPKFTPLEAARRWVALTEKVNAGTATYGDSLRLDEIVDYAPAICEALLRMETALRGLVENIDSGVTPEVFAATERDRPEMSTLAHARAALSPRTPQADGET